MIDKNNAGENIKSIRTNLDVSQERFAEMLCVSTQAVSKWETGNSLPDIEVLLKLSWIGKRTINKILDGSTDYITDVNGVQRDLYRIANIAKCPSCNTNMRVDAADKMKIHLTCENGHKTACVDGVVDFKTQEIKGEDWSYYSRNYDQYLELRQTPPDPRILQGDPNMV
jgi:DNA-binding XRE family transcriptional regulator